MKIIISTEMAAVVMNRITKTDEAKVAAKMIVLSSCNEELMLETKIIIDEFKVDPELLVGFNLTVELIKDSAKEIYHFDMSNLKYCTMYVRMKVRI